ncbi:MAG: hypothetical protein LUQ61_07910 [Methanoregulaceae archaeon]|jgi:hypothetical protein|nr:hypothetical protein [Methanoregulaceae archaeon]
MPSIGPVVETRSWRQHSRAGSPFPVDPHEQKRCEHLFRTGTHPQDSGQAVIEVGNSRFIVRSGDGDLIRELLLFTEGLRGDPRAEVRFTVKLLSCTEQGRLRPWGWQRQPAQVV